jgi:DNA-binding XRE family transcriptional regulator
MGKVKFRSYPDLATWRNDRKWTQQEAADFLGITQSKYSRLERGIGCAWGEEAKVLHERTGVPVAVLAGAA